MSILYEYTIIMMFRGGHQTDSVEGNQTVDKTNLINKKQKTNYYNSLFMNSLQRRGVLFFTS